MVMAFYDVESKSLLLASLILLVVEKKIHGKQFNYNFDV